MLEIISGEVSTSYKKKHMIQNDKEQWINTHTWIFFNATADLKLCQYWDNVIGRLFQATRTIVENYKKMSTLVPVPQHCIGFSYIHSEDYELDLNFDKIDTKIKSDLHLTIKLYYFAKILRSLRRASLLI